MTMDTSETREAVPDRRRDGGSAEVAPVVGQPHEAAVGVQQAPPDHVQQRVEHEEVEDDREGRHQRVADQVLAGQPVADQRGPGSRAARGRAPSTLARGREDAEGLGPERERQLGALGRAQARERGGRHVALQRGRAVGQGQAQAGEGAQELDGADARDEPVLRAQRGADRDLLGPDRQGEPGARGDRARRLRGASPPRRAAPTRPARPRSRPGSSSGPRSARRTASAGACRPRPARPPAPPPRGSSPRCGRPWPAPPPGRASP